MTMTYYQVAEVKAKLSAVLKEVEEGEDVMITRGRNCEPVACLVAADKWKRKNKRELGTLAYLGPFYMAEDWKFDDEEMFEDDE